MKNHNNKASIRHSQDKKINDAKRLFKALFKEPTSRRMGATKIGYTDQTYMVTQTIKDWIKQDRAQVVSLVKCPRSGRMVQGVTTNPNLFKKSNQLKMF